MNYPVEPTNSMKITREDKACLLFLILGLIIGLMF
jgi:hypothetical protein